MKQDSLRSEVFIACPFDLLLDKYLPVFFSERLQPEIGLNGGPIDQYPLNTFKKVARMFKKEGLACTVHAPFIDLSMGAIDKKVRKLTVERMKKAVDIASIFEARSMVCHTGYDRKHYFSLKDTWFKNAIESFQSLEEHASYSHFPIMIENVFELGPDIHKKILHRIDSKRFGFCLDVGHQKVFSDTDIMDWLNELDAYLGQVHLHDNMGEVDDHMAIGKGVIDFESLFSFLKRKGKTPIFTIEAHKAEAVSPSLKTLQDLLERHHMPSVIK